MTFSISECFVSNFILFVNEKGLWKKFDGVIAAYLSLKNV